MTTTYGTIKSHLVDPYYNKDLPLQQHLKYSIAVTETTSERMET